MELYPNYPRLTPSLSLSRRSPSALVPTPTCRRPTCGGHAAGHTSLRCSRASPPNLPHICNSSAQAPNSGSMPAEAAFGMVAA
eukprot:scaffold115314_cov75-Phaeocystis_antarctica.AAC.1